MHFSIRTAIACDGRFADGFALLLGNQVSTTDCSILIDGCSTSIAVKAGAA